MPIKLLNRSSWERFIGTVEEAEQLSTTTETDTAELLISRHGQFRKYTKGYHLILHTLRNNEVATREE